MISKVGGNKGICPSSPWGRKRAKTFMRKQRSILQKSPSGTGHGVMNYDGFCTWWILTRKLRSVDVVATFSEDVCAFSGCCSPSHQRCTDTRSKGGSILFPMCIDTTVLYLVLIYSWTYLISVTTVNKEMGGWDLINGGYDSRISFTSRETAEILFYDERKMAG